MRRSSAGGGGGRPSLALRVKNGDQKQKTRLSSGSTGSYGSRSSIGGRLSLTGGKRGIPRPSSVGLGGGPAKLSRRSSAVAKADSTKDPRRVTDKSFKDKSIREMVEFLTTNGYPHQISLKMLHTPTTKDFSRIFEFLHGFSHPGYKMGPKMEEEVPRILKIYGYPFPIPKSAMFTVGSPHTWPILLAALSWMRQQYQYAIETDIEDVIFAPKENSCEFDNISQEKLLFDFTEKTYMDYMNGQDDFTEHEENFAREMKKYFEGGSIDSLAAENRRLNEELKMLQEHPDELIDLKDRFTFMRLDNEKIVNFDKELNNKLQQLQMTRDNLNTEIATAESEMQTISSDNQKKQHIFETQEFSRSDVQRINMERQQLQRQIAGVENETEDLDKNIWNEEMDISKFQDKVDGKCAEYNKLAQMLQLVPTSAANAYGIDYEMKPTLYGTEKDKFLNIIKPALTKVKSQCVEKVAEQQERKFNEQETLDQLAEMAQEKKEAIGQMEAQLKSADSDMEASKESFGRDYQRLQLEVDIVQEDVKLLRKQSGMTAVDAEKALLQDKTKFDRGQKERDSQIMKHKNFLQEVCKLVVDHKTYIQDHMEKVEQKFQNTLNKAREEADKLS